MTMVLVVTWAFSVGTARLYSCSWPEIDTAGLTRACPSAMPGTTSAATSVTRAASEARVVAILSFTGGILLLRD